MFLFTFFFMTLVRRGLHSTGSLRKGWCSRAGTLLNPVIGDGADCKIPFVLFGFLACREVFFGLEFSLFPCCELLLCGFAIKLVPNWEIEQLIVAQHSNWSVPICS